MNEIVEMVGEVAIQFLFEAVPQMLLESRQPPEEPSPEELARWEQLLLEHARRSSPQEPLGLLR